MVADPIQRGVNTVADKVQSDKVTVSQQVFQLLMGCAANVESCH